MKWKFGRQESALTLLKRMDGDGIEAECGGKFWNRKSRPED